MIFFLTFFPDCNRRFSLYLIFNKIPVGALKPLLFHKKKVFPRPKIGDYFQRRSFYLRRVKNEHLQNTTNRGEPHNRSILLFLQV